MKSYFLCCCTCSVRATQACWAGSWGLCCIGFMRAFLLVLLASYAMPIWMRNTKESERVLAKNEGWTRELIFVDYVPRELVNWGFYSFMSFCWRRWAAVLCCCGSEMLKTVNRYLLRFSGSFFVGKLLVRQILAGNLVSLLGFCSAVLCQALQQYTGCILFTLNTVVAHSRLPMWPICLKRISLHLDTWINTTVTAADSETTQ